MELPASRWGIDPFLNMQTDQSKFRLLALAIGGFGIGTTEFAVMGLLPEIAGSLKISIPEAGHMISAYALGVVVGAPILTGMAGRFAPAKILMAFMVLFTLFNGLTALAFNPQSLLVFRFLAGLPHGAFFGVGAVVASRLAAPGRGASAVAVMFSGLTVANVVGVPMTTYIGHHWGWRISFCLVAFIGAVTVYSIHRWIPKLSPQTGGGFRKDLQILKRVNLWLAIAIISIGYGGFFAWMSYLVPLFTKQAGFSQNAVPFLMALVGIGMTFGNWLGGKLADRFRPLSALIGLMLLLTIILCLNGAFSTSQPMLVVLTFITATVAMALGVPIQLLLIAHSKGAEMFGASLGQSSFNIGNALGAYFGGIPLMMGYSYASPQWVGAVMSLLGALIGGYLYSRVRSDKTAEAKVS
jgi:MFS transporter, DHA1 family, arabinose polymer utilization protein